MNQDRKQKEIKKMERVWKIYTHPLYTECVKKNDLAEEGRIFCRHNIQHFLDVARLAYLFTMERGYVMNKEVIYAAAFLHDVGKWMQYTQGIPHEIASAQIAEQILLDTNWTKEEREEILESILKHRGDLPKKETECVRGNAEKLTEVLYDADKISRSCFGCAAKETCNWKEEKKNLQIIW